jgi:hypothetical protein
VKILKTLDAVQRLAAVAERGAAASPQQRNRAIIEESVGQLADYFVSGALLEAAPAIALTGYGSAVALGLEIGGAGLAGDLAGDAARWGVRTFFKVKDWLNEPSAATLPPPSFSDPVVPNPLP